MELNYDAFVLDNIVGLGAQTILKLLDSVESEKEILTMSESQIRDIAGQNAARAIKHGPDKKYFDRNFRMLEELNVQFVPFSSKKYPQKLREIPNSPYALYVRGELPDESKPSVAIIGARQCSAYGKEVAESIGYDLGMMDIQVVSGMAVGIDSIAQRAALKGGGKTFGVMGNGVDICYPQSNSDLYFDAIENGGIISEYNIGTPTGRQLFPARNRIISGLADIVLVVEARKKSGTYITVSQALEQGKEIYAVPGRVTDGLSDGCNRLISQGAGMALSAESIAEGLASMGRGWSIKEGKIKGIGLIEENAEDPILRELDNTPIDIEVLLLRLLLLGIGREEMIYRLTVLEIEGKVQKIGNTYIKNKKMT